LIGNTLARFAMRNIISILLGVLTVLVGCHSPSPTQSQMTAPTGATAVAATQPFRPMLVTTHGTHASSGGRWRIGVSESAVELSRWNAYSDGHGSGVSGWSSISPQGWKPQAGWFVFVESESRVWAYDGGLQVLV